jgi:hypothetical protein
MSELSLLRDISGKAYHSAQDRQSWAQENDLQMVTNKGELAAYRSENKKKIYVAHRGTKKVKDLSADLAILTGTERFHPRFKRAKRETAKLQRQNPGYQIIQTGHSLGGSVAEFAGKNKIVTFSKGAGIGALLRKRGKHQTDYINVLDPISTLTTFQRGGTLRKQIKFTTHPHKIESATSTFL